MDVNGTLDSRAKFVFYLQQNGVVGYNMGLSENSVPLNPMVNDHYPY